MKTNKQRQWNKRQVNWKRIFLLAIALPFIPLPSSAAYLQPWVYYGVDQTGLPLTNALTISAWPATNQIVGLGTNIVGNVAHTYTPDTNGYVSNNIAPGNYRLQIAGYTGGVPFGIVSNSSPQNLSQVANLPVVTFLNFTLAQFRDAGTMAWEGTNTFARKTYLDVSNAVAFVLATNGGPLAYSQLPFTPPTNSYSALTNVLGFVPATNLASIAAGQLPFAAATNNPATNTIVFVSAVAGITNGSGYITNLTVTLSTNTINYQQR